MLRPHFVGRPYCKSFKSPRPLSGHVSELKSEHRITVVNYLDYSWFYLPEWCIPSAAILPVTDWRHHGHQETRPATTVEDNTPSLFNIPARQVVGLFTSPFDDEAQFLSFAKERR